MSQGGASFEHRDGADSAHHPHDTWPGHQRHDESFPSPKPPGAMKPDQPDPTGDVIGPSGLITAQRPPTTDHQRR